MNLNSVSIVSLLIFYFCTITTSSDNPTHSSNEVSINCGSIGTFAARNGREWHGDGHKISSLVKIKGSSTTSHVINQNLISDPIPYKTARISRSPFSYKLQINPGQKILRFHFSSALYKGFKQYKDFFDVEAGPFTLLRNFSATLAAEALGVNSFVKEFCVDIKENQMFNITFSPTTSQFRDTYAYINGIEIVSVPANRSYFHIEDVGVQFIGKSPVYIDSNTALEIIRRLNAKQDFVLLSTDHIGDGLQIRGTVPEQGGNKANSITWKTPVDVGFRYVVRLHFSRLGFKIAEIGGFMFEFLINGMVVTTNSDSFKERDANSIDWYRDYSVVMNGRKQVGKRDLLISMLSNDEFLEGHGPLKGFEILKLSNRDNSLASPNPLRFVNPPSYQSLQILLKVLCHMNKIVNGAILVLVLLNIISYTFRMIQESGQVEEENIPPVKAGRLCRRFSLAELQLATKHFSRSHLIGRGGFGKVYKGTIDDKNVAIKRLKSNSNQGAREFLTEIETLMEVRHVNLVSLIGYCNDSKEMILVYEYMASGTLADHLFKLVCDEDNISSLTWKQRLTICIGAGRGLDYLHTGVSIIHRDVKASNILLDEDFTAKVADFGLAKPLIPSKLQQSHISTKVKGTFGYLDPEYLLTGKLTMKSDVYSFGVVLFELLSGRRAFDPHVLEDERNLVKWAKESICKGRIDHVVDSILRGKFSVDSLKTFVDISERCLHNEPKDRPTMAEVVLSLQLALEQQESPKSASKGRSGVDDKGVRPSPNLVLDSDLETISESENIVENTTKTVPEVQMKNSFNEDEHIPTPPLKEQFDNSAANVKSASDRTEPSKARTPKRTRLWTGFSFWNKRDPFANNAFLLPVNELKNVIDFFGKKQFNNKSVCYGHLRSGQAAAFRNLKQLGLSDQAYLTQVSSISSLKHENVAEVLGYSVHGRLQVLAYEHACNGSLHDILHGWKGNGSAEPGLVLTWMQRVKISVGAAKGLEYLHGKEHTHGHIKSKNILIFTDAEVAKVTDFHMPSPKREGPEEDGYTIDELPTLKRDVYKFGVVLLELLTGRKPLDDTLPMGQQLLVSWAKPYLTKNKVDQCIDARLNGKYPAKLVAKMAYVAEACIQPDAYSRPNMTSVVNALQPLLDA